MMRATKSQRAERRRDRAPEALSLSRSPEPPQSLPDAWVPMSSYDLAVHLFFVVIGAACLVLGATVRVDPNDTSPEGTLRRVRKWVGVVAAAALLLYGLRGL